MLRKCTPEALEEVLEQASNDRIESLDVRRIDGGDFQMDIKLRKDKDTDELGSMETRSRVMKHLEEFAEAVKTETVKTFSLIYEAKANKVVFQKSFSDRAPMLNEQEDLSISSQAAKLLSLAGNLKVEDEETDLFTRVKSGKRYNYKRASLGTVLRMLVEGKG